MEMFFKNEKLKERFYKIKKDGFCLKMCNIKNKIKKSPIKHKHLKPSATNRFELLITKPHKH